MLKKSIIGMLLAVVFCFSGCSWFDMGGTTPGGGSGGNNDYNDDRIQDSVGEHVPPEIDVSEDEAKENESYAKITQGVRASYLPTKFDETDDSVLAADRRKFDENAALQYEIVAQSVLFYLTGRYGETAGNNASEIVYEFYADTSKLPSGDATQATITLPRTAPIEENVSLLHTTASAIERQTTGLEGSYSLATDSWTLSRTETNAYKWNFSLGTSVTAGYNERFIAEFTPIVQVNLMEYALNFPLSSKADILAETPESMIESYVAKIQRLGITQSQEFADFLYDYILSIIIGENATSWDNLRPLYTEPVDSYTEEVPSEINPDETVEQTVFVYYDMDGNPDTHTFTAPQLYKYNYITAAQNIVELVAGTFDTNGEVVNPAIFAEFPTYTRLEITDIAPDKFYTAGEKGDSDVLSLDSMEYHEYQSAIIYPDGIFNYDVDAEEGEDLTQKLWQFDVLNLYIDSKEDITLDVYIRLHINGTNYIEHISRINTDSAKSFDFEGESDALGEDSVASSADEYFIESKLNYTIIDMRTFLDDERIEMLTTGIENTTNKNFYAEEGGYKDTFAGKLGSSVAFGNELKVTNHYGETVNLDKYALCNDTGDFVEIIFAPVKDKGENYDYRFKFLVRALYWGVFDEDLELNE